MGEMNVQRAKITCARESFRSQGPGCNDFPTLVLMAMSTCPLPPQSLSLSAGTAGQGSLCIALGDPVSARLPVQHSPNLESDQQGRKECGPATLGMVCME